MRTNYKKIALLAFSFIIMLKGFTQNNKVQHPFQIIDKDVEVLTLSNGKYNEFFDTDSIEIIGDAIFNVNTRKVIGFVEYDTTYSEATMLPEITSRWLSPDPLAREFPHSSPYVGFENNPIFYTDPDGQAVKAVNVNARVGLQEAITSIFDNGQELNNPNNFIGVDERGNVRLSPTVRDKKGRFTKEFKAALKTIESDEVRELAVAFIEAVESETQNLVQVVTNEESQSTGTRQEVGGFEFNTSDKTTLPENGSSTFVDVKGRNATLTISATETINNPDRIPGQTKDVNEMTSTTIGDNKSEALEVIKAITTGNKVKNP